VLASCQKDTVRRVDYAIEGIDVSRYQLAINWDTVAHQGIHFAFVKATEGATHLDTLFQKNWTAIREAGLRRGAYHFFRPATDPILQAQHFINQVELLDGDLPPVLDIEVLDNQHPTFIIASLKTWLDEVYQHYGVRPILYTNLKYYNKHLAGHFDDYPLWIARYNDDEPVLACGRDWQFWQYGNRGEIAGIEGYVDFNVFSGSWQDLEQLTYGTDTVLSQKTTNGAGKRYLPLLKPF
jgi:lysozyme